MTRLSIAIGLALMLSACFGQGHFGDASSHVFFSGRSASITDPDECAAAMHRHQEGGSTSLPPGPIRLLNWNIQKNTGFDLRTDMDRVSEGADLILLQEATRNLPFAVGIPDGYHDTFAPGYQSSRADTGVLTVSKVRPLTQCSFKYSEPWLRSPKATNLTQFSLGERDETLLVVNLHLVNFTVGVSDLRSQLDEAVRVIEEHEGPVIVSGDFNTWSQKRGNAVREAFRSLSLSTIGYDEDTRKRIFGNALDHVYVRGMEVIHSTSHLVSSSDHNPMSAVLKLWDDQSPEGLKGLAGAE